MALDKQLTGKNFCGLDCVDNQNVIHPETCVDNVVTANNSTKTLNEWLSYGTEEHESGAGTFTATDGMLDWLETYYPRGSYSLPIASTTTLGGIKVGSHLVINDGVLSVRSRDLVPTDPSALLIAKFANPEAESTPNLYPADWDGRGVIKLGNDAILPEDFSNDDPEDNDYDMYPVRLDSKGHAGISVAKPDWNTLLHQPTIPIVNDSTITVTQGGVTKGTFTLNQNSDYTITIDSNTSIEDFEGTDGIDDGEAGLVPAPTISDVNKFLKSDGTWDTVQTTDDNLKNYKVISEPDRVYRRNGTTYFGSYNIENLITNYKFKGANIYDFREVNNNYNTVQNIDTTVEYHWKITTPESGINIAIIDAKSVDAKGYFQLEIEPSGSAKKTYNVGFIIDTPPSIDCFAWFSDCPWPISVYNTSTLQDRENSIRVYLGIPSDFEGDIYVKNKYLITYYSGGVPSFRTFDGNNATEWLTNNSITGGTYTALPDGLSPISTPVYDDQSHIVIPTNGKISIDYFVYNPTRLNINDMLYDNIVNNCLLHKLIRNGN